MRQIAERKFGMEATRYGRNGQAQHGVDITLRNAHGHLIAIQSKHTESLTGRMMADEMDKFFGRTTSGTAFPARNAVAEYIFATSAQTDTSQTDKALELSTSNAPLRVTVWAWGHINSLLNTMPSLAGQYCFSILGPRPLSDVRQEHARFVRQALTRPALLDTWRHETDFHTQIDALRDVAGFFETGNLYDRNRTLVSSVTPYAEDDDYRESLLELQRRIIVFTRHIERNASALASYPVGPNGRVLDRSDLALARVHLDFEAKRLKVVELANKIFTQYNLSRLEDRV